MAGWRLALGVQQVSASRFGRAAAQRHRRTVVGWWHCGNRAQAQRSAAAGRWHCGLRRPGADRSSRALRSSGPLRLLWFSLRRFQIRYIAMP